MIPLLGRERIEREVLLEDVLLHGEEGLLNALFAREAREPQRGRLEVAPGREEDAVLLDARALAESVRRLPGRTQRQPPPAAERPAVPVRARPSRAERARAELKVAATASGPGSRLSKLTEPAKDAAPTVDVPTPRWTCTLATFPARFPKSAV